MTNHSNDNWEKKVVTPEQILEKIKPGMSIYIGTGPAEPRTLVKALTSSEAYNLQDLELIQLVSVGDAISQDELKHQRYRLKTFFSGWISNDAITSGKVDLIPSRFDQIPTLMESRRIPIDVAIIQITPPNEAGYCSLGVAVDVARIAMEQASLVIGEINTKIPRTFGDTFVPVSSFDFLVYSKDLPIYFDPWPEKEIFNKVAENVATIIEDGSCIASSIGTLFEHLGKHLERKRDLGIHTPFFSDNMMNLIKSGAVTNRKKGHLSRTISHLICFWITQIIGLVRSKSSWLNFKELIRYLIQCKSDKIQISLRLFRPEKLTYQGVLRCMLETKVLLPVWRRQLQLSTEPKFLKGDSPYSAFPAGIKKGNQIF